MEMNYTVLFVDDDVPFLSLVRRMFIDDFHLITTTDPRQALNIIKNNGPVAVIVSDYMMPIINGVDLFSEVLRIDKSVQRILLTGVPDVNIAMDAINRGKANAFLTKPVDRLALHSSICEAIVNYKEIRLSTYFLREGIDFLTAKEKEILFLLTNGFSNREIAQDLNISLGTVKTHLINMLRKMNVTSRSKIVAKGLELGLIEKQRSLPSVSKETPLKA